VALSRAQRRHLLRDFANIALKRTDIQSDIATMIAFSVREMNLGGTRAADALAPQQAQAHGA
jgi:hypothetical protein